MSDVGPKQVIGVVFALLLAVPMVTAYVGVVDDVSEPDDVSEDVILNKEGVGSLSATGRVGNLSAKQSLGTAIRFTGAPDSELIGGTAPEPDANWTVTTWGRLNQSAALASSRRLLQVGGWLYVDYINESWVVTYYDEDALEVHQANISAPSPRTWTQIGVVSNGTHLVVFRNSTRVMTQSMASGGADVPAVGNWYGTAEETRVFDDELSHSQINASYNTPTRAVADSDKLARVMYDMRDGEATVDVYWASGQLKQMNVTVVPGFAGETITRGSALLGGDYKFDQDTNTIRTNDNRALDGAPVVFVDYAANVEGALSGVTGTIVRVAGALLGLLLLLPIITRLENAL